MSLQRPTFEDLPVRGAITVGLVTGIAILGAQAVEAYAARYLVEKHLDAQHLQIDTKVTAFEGAVADATDSARRYAATISYRTEDLAREQGALQTFAQRDADGVWRSRRDQFRADVEAGVWIPPDVSLTEETQRFFLRARRKTALFGQGALNDLFVDTWTLPLTNGEIIYFPSTPEFIYDAPAKLDYRDTEWVQLTSPTQNPTGAPRWTSTSYDPAAKQWMISVVAPFTKDGQWAGAVGHDILLSKLFSTLLADRTGPSQLTPYYISKADGGLLLRDGGVPAVDERLPAEFKQLILDSSDELAPHFQVFGEDYLISSRLPTLNATVIYRVDGAQVERALQVPLFRLKLAQAGATALFFLLAYLWVSRDARVRRHRQEALFRQNQALEALVTERTKSLTQVNAQLEQLMMQDHLTGLGNRRMFELALNTAWQRDLRSQGTLAVLMIDVDQFKSYNDLCGHQAGDACLQQVASVLASSIHRADDVAARYGGEEFVVILPDTDVYGAQDVARRVQERLQAVHLPHPGTPSGQLTVSIGIATIVPTVGVEPYALVRCADAALYEAKQAGRNRWHTADVVEPCRTHPMTQQVALF